MWPTQTPTNARCTALNHEEWRVDIYGTVATGTNPVSVTLILLEVCLRANQINSVSRYTIDANTGLLTSVGVTPAGTEPMSVALDPSGRFAYVGDVGFQQYLMYGVDQHHRSIDVQRTVASGMYPYPVVVDPSGKFAYVAKRNSNNIASTHNRCGHRALTSMGTPPAGTSPDSLAITAKVSNCRSIQKDPPRKNGHSPR